MDLDLDLTHPTTPHRRVSPGSAVVGGVLLAVCGGDAVEPTDAETGILTVVPADPAASPAESDDPADGIRALTGRNR